MKDRKLFASLTMPLQKMKNMLLYFIDKIVFPMIKSIVANKTKNHDPWAFSE